MLIDAVVHAVNEDYEEMAGDFIKLGFLSAGKWDMHLGDGRRCLLSGEQQQSCQRAGQMVVGVLPVDRPGRQAGATRAQHTRCPPVACVSRPPFTRPCLTITGTDISPIVPALEKIWRDSKGQQLSDFNFRTVTSKFNELVYQYPIRIPERYSLVIRSLLTQVCGGWACGWEGGRVGRGGFLWSTGAAIGLQGRQQLSVLLRCGMQSSPQRYSTFVTSPALCSVPFPFTICRRASA